MGGGSGGSNWFGNIGEVFKNIFSTIKDLFSSIFSVISDLIGSIAKGITSLFGGIFGGIFHGGGISGHATMFRQVPMLAFAGAPRFHGGFYPGEYPAILDEEEAVVPLAGGKAIPVTFRGEQKQESPKVNIQVITRDPETKVKYKPSRSMQRATLVNVSRRGMVDI